MAQCMMISMLALMFVTTLPAVGAGAEETLPVLQGIAEPKKADESQHFTFREHNGNHYSGQYRYGGKDVPFSADLTSEDGKLILTGVVTLPDPIEPEPFVMTKEGDRGWVLEIFGSEFEMIFKNIPFQGENWTVPMPHGCDIPLIYVDCKPYGFWMGKFELTDKQWNALMANNGAGSDLPKDVRDWNQAMAYCKKLTEQERAAGRLPVGYEYTLPTGTMWEYAARGGDSIDYAGLDKRAWYKDNSGDQLHPVGQKLPNSLGFHDMIGNAWEWTSDKTLRGGSFSDSAIDCNCSKNACYTKCRDASSCGHAWVTDSTCLEELRLALQDCFGNFKHGQYSYSSPAHRVCRTCLGFRVALVPVQ